MRYAVAAVQFEPAFADKARNVAALCELVRQAAHAGARLVVLPEMGTTGYCFRSRLEVAPLVEMVPSGPTTATFTALAAELGVHIVVGLPEVDPATGAYHNTAMLLGPDGFIGKYRKTHSFVDETRWARDGDLGIPVFDTELGRIALLICMDASYMEPARLAALAGADVIAFPTNWLGNQTAWRARALENGVYMVCANRWGEERGTKFCGNTAVIDPKGVVANLLSTGDGVALGSIDLDLARAARAVALAEREPARYHELLINSYLWPWHEAQRLPAGRPVAVAVGEAASGGAMADRLRWADKRGRDRGWPALDLAVFPALAEAVDERVVAEAAHALGCYVVWGAPGPGGADEVWLMGPQGLVCRYRSRPGETVVEHSGAARVEVDGGYALLDLPWGRLGLITGADLALPEPARIQAKRGADLIAVPARWTDSYSRLLWQARCAENETVFAVANAAGDSRIHQPAPPYVTPAGGPDDMALALIDTADRAIRAKEHLRMLQPQWYAPLAATGL